MANPADLSALRQVCQSLAGRAKKLQQFSKAQQQAKQKVEREVNKAGYMEDIIRLRFLQQRTSVDGGTQWDPTKPPSNEHAILRDTGKLLNAAVRAVRNTFKIGTPIKWSIAKVNLPYAEVHQVKGVKTSVGNGIKFVTRKFFNDPTKKELAAAYAYAAKMVKQLTAVGLGIKGVRR
jgi:hypothetical protein